MLTIAEYFWRLIPANPILLRVVQMNGKRRRDMFIRCGYLGLLIAVVLFSISGAGSGDLAQLSQISSTLFQHLSILQLGLVALLAPIFTASAITQERDSQTYDILLTTPLSNGQIVLGSLLSRLFFVIALLISGVPIFSMTQIFGGVAISAIVQSFLIAAATALVTGAVAMAIAVLKVGTRRTIFSFYMFIVLYLVGTYMLDLVPSFKFQVFNAAKGVVEPSTTGWLTGLNPFLALRTIFHDKAYLPPMIGDLAPELQRWPIGVYLSNPAGFYITFMFLISFVLITPSVLLLRRLAQSTVSIQTVILQKLNITRGDRTRKPRAVWSNPIAWREARTKASAARSMVLRYGFIIAGLGGALVMLFMFATSAPTGIPTYIDYNSYNPALHQLTVYNSVDGTVTPRPIDRNITISYTDPEAFNVDGTPMYASSINIETLMQYVGRKSVSVVATTMKSADGLESWTSINATAIPRKLSAMATRQVLLGASIIEFAVILLIVTNAAASTVTREKEDGTLDLLLSTPITSMYYIWGKLRGLVSFVLPLLAVPLVSAAIFVVYDLVRSLHEWNDRSFSWIVYPEALLLLPGMLVIVVAFAAILGMNMSLRLRKTVSAVMCSIGIVAGICALTGFCGYSMLSTRSMQSAGLVAASFSPFTLLTMLISPDILKTDLFNAENEGNSRMVIFVVTFVAIGVYTGVVWAMYKSMVKNFDMTIRKQSR